LCSRANENFIEQKVAAAAAAAEKWKILKRHQPQQKENNF